MSWFSVPGLLALILVLSDAPARADAFVRCAQNQFSALGFDPGPVDGAMGPRTRAAAAAFLADQSPGGRLGLLSPLHRETALEWCRDIAVIHSQARAFLPSNTPPEIIADGGPDGFQARLLAEAFRQTQRRFLIDFAVRPASRIDLAGSTDEKRVTSYIDALVRQRGYRITGHRAAVEKQCNNLRHTGAYASRSYMAFCWDDRLDFSDALFRGALNLIEPTMRHEYMHHLQFELANDKALRNWPAAARRKTGPSWMVEGTAEVMERYEEADKLALNVRIFHAKFRAGRSTLPLAELRSRAGIEKPYSYGVAHFAALLLAERFGKKALFDYFRALGRGIGWEEAFLQVFGMELVAFEAELEVMRGDIGAAIAFAQGSGQAGKPVP